MMWLLLAIPVAACLVFWRYAEPYYPTEEDGA